MLGLGLGLGSGLGLGLGLGLWLPTYLHDELGMETRRLGVG